MTDQRPFVVAVTGGIGSGKTTVCDCFSERFDIPVIDTDQIARDVVQPGQPGLDEIVEQFGAGILSDDGNMDRGKVRELVFADEEKRKTLESILHPRIRQTMSERIHALDSPYCLLGIPLLAANHDNQLIDRVLVVDCSEQTQLSRVMERDSLTPDQAKAIMRTQASRDERLSLADDVILNEGEVADLTDQVSAMHSRYMALAQGSA